MEKSPVSFKTRHNEICYVLGGQHNSDDRVVRDSYNDGGNIYRHRLFPVQTGHRGNDGRDVFGVRPNDGVTESGTGQGRFDVFGL